ncbi:unnamed protein product [Paramecium pentaurelia]|uniref:Uncharacterized protein n=1 Tax=Paramecium pentaurelia TaxID=43138 RepID=A0A8S1XKQ9_9CILI|nr:unnamed protein product [Paramecium pentaurelia]
MPQKKIKSNRIYKISHKNQIKLYDISTNLLFRYKEENNVYGKDKLNFLTLQFRTYLYIKPQNFSIHFIQILNITRAG